MCMLWNMVTNWFVILFLCFLYSFSYYNCSVLPQFVTTVVHNWDSLPHFAATAVTIDDVWDRSNRNHEGLKYRLEVMNRWCFNVYINVSKWWIQITTPLPRKISWEEKYRIYCLWKDCPSWQEKILVKVCRNELVKSVIVAKV